MFALIVSLMATPSAFAAGESLLADDQVVQFDLRVGFGSGSRFQANERGQLAIDASAILRVGLDKQSSDWDLVRVIVPEISYGYLGRERGGADGYLVGGLGLGYANDWFALGAVPQIGAGRFSNAEGIDRTGVGGRLLVDLDLVHIVGLQAAYGGFIVNGHLQHDARVMFSLNAIPLLLFFTH
jgi:hypothetical protein